MKLILSALVATMVIGYTNCSGFRTASLEAATGSDSSSSTTPGGPAISPAPSFKTSTLSSTELLENPTFANGLTSWGDYGGTEVLPSPLANNEAMVHMKAHGGFSQLVAVTPGKRYRVSLLAKTTVGDQGSVVSTTISRPGFADITYHVDVYSSEFRPLTYDVVVPSNVNEFSVNVWCNGGGDGSSFTRFSVREVLSLVEPQALFDDGDSISVAPHAPWFAAGLPDLLFMEQAVGGAGLDGNSNTLFARKPAMLQKIADHPGALVTVLIGANDLHASDPAAYAAHLFEYCDDIRAHGARIAVGTVLPQGTALLPSSAIHNQKRLTLNSLIRAAVGTHVDAVIDYAMDPIMGVEASADDTRYFIDGLHPTWTPGGGQDRMSRIYGDVVKSMLRR